MGELKLTLIIIVCCLLGISVLWIDEIGQLFSVSDQATQQVTAQQGSAQSQQHNQDQSVQTESLPINQVLPELQRLTQPLDSELSDDSTEQQMTHLQQKADLLIEEMDQLVADIEYQEPEISPEQQDEILQYPEFEQSIEREAALEQRLQSLP